VPAGQKAFIHYLFIQFSGLLVTLNKKLHGGEILSQPQKAELKPAVLNGWYWH